MMLSMDHSEEQLGDPPAVFLQTTDLLFAAVMQNHAIYPELKDKSALGIKDGEQNHVYLLRDTAQVTLDSGVDSPDESAEGKRVIEEPRQSSIVTIFSIWNTMMGTSILAMPWTLSQAGFSLGIILILLVAAIASYTAYLVVQATEDIRFIKNLPRSVYVDIADASEYHFGKAGRIIALVFSQVATIGASIVYYVLLSNFLYNTGEYIFRSATHQFPTTPTIIVNGREINNMLCPSRNITVESPIDNAVFNKLWVIDRTVPVWLLLILFPLISIKSPTFLGKFTTLGKCTPTLTS
ncbi:unnamed protein product [Dicrocoelium dendriticum]|nr:unnamed protein product [Dicrocoelium dendriticum]